MTVLDASRDNVECDTVVTVSFFANKDYHLEIKKYTSCLNMSKFNTVLSLQGTNAPCKTIKGFFLMTNFVFAVNGSR